MAGTYILRGENEYGDAVSLTAQTCLRCGALVNVFEVPMDEHERVAHPVPCAQPHYYAPPEQRRA